MRLRTLICLVLAASLLILPACSHSTSKSEDVKPSKKALKNLNKTGMPIVKKPITLDMFAPEQNNKANWNDILIWNTYAKKTNIKTKWKQVAPDALEEKRNLALGSGNLPDVFYISSLPNTDIYKYGKQGTLLKLNDLIDQYAPNLKKLMKKDPNIKKAMTFPDGNIYSMPSLVDPDFLSLKVSARPYVNEKWLKALGMDMPKTTEDFYQYLKAVKTGDPNGNGKHDEIPLGGPSTADGGVSADIINYFKGSFGVANKGVRNTDIDLDPKTKKVRFYPISDGYKEMLQYLHKLYKEKLLDPGIFTTKWDQYIANATKGKYGSFVFYDPVTLFGEKTGKQFESMSTLKGPDGDDAFTKVAPNVASIGNFAITKHDKHPAATIRWLDYFYSDEGAKLFYMGVKGKTYKVTKDGKYEYLDKIKHPKNGLSMEQEVSKYLAWVGGFTGIVKQKYYSGSEGTEGSIKAAHKLEPYIPKDIWPAFTYTEEENKFLTSQGKDIEKYVDEMQDKFIAGKASFDEWDKYVDRIKDMGLDQYLKIQQKAYKRYTKS